VHRWCARAGKIWVVTERDHTTTKHRRIAIHGVVDPASASGEALHHLVDHAREAMKKKIFVLFVALMLFCGCARPLTMKNETIPLPPSAQAIWVYGHYNPQGKWVPGRWIE
jgi:hypothetical protein